MGSINRVPGQAPVHRRSWPTQNELHVLCFVYLFCGFFYFVLFWYFCLIEFCCFGFLFFCFYFCLEEKERKNMKLGE